MPLYLLEVDWLTDALYGGDREHRIRQELLLGVGGVRALAALGIEPNVFHLNEGHSAFLQLERLRALVADGADDRRRARDDPALVRLHDAHARCRRATRSSTRSSSSATSAISPPRAGLDRERLLELGRFGDEPGFGLTPFALRLSAYAERRLRSPRRGRA